MFFIRNMKLLFFGFGLNFIFPTVKVPTDIKLEGRGVKALMALSKKGIL